MVKIGRDEMQGAAGERYTQTVSEVRPRGIQNWIAVSDSGFGVTIGSSVAVWDFRDPTDSPSENPLLQPVLLASRRSCHGEGPWYLQAGDHHYRFSLLSHPPAWAHAQRFGLEANTPLFAVWNPQREDNAGLPERKAFLSFDTDNVRLSALKRSEDSETVILRLYELAGRSTEAGARFGFRVHGVEETNLIEDPERQMPSSPGGMKLRIGGHAIQTYKLVPAL
jgi:alpha-mannosidase